MIGLTICSLVLGVLAPFGQDTLATGRTLLGLGNAVGAEAEFRRVLEDEPENPRAWNLLGRALHAQRKLEDALEAYERAAEHPEVEAVASYNAACAMARLEEPDLSFYWLERAHGAGFADRDRMLGDAELGALRGDERFAAVLPPLRTGASAFREETRVLHALQGAQPNEEFGWVARSLGDLDGDGVWDFASTGPGFRVDGTPAGRVVVTSGKTGEQLHELHGPKGLRFGNSVAGHFDADGDGTPDFVVGAPGHGGQVGRAFVFSGKTGARLHALAAGEVGDYFGMKVSGIGDLTGDGRDEVVVGAMRADAEGKDHGRVHVFDGASGDELFTLDGEAPGDLFGSAVDATKEGEHRLLVVGAYQAGPRRTGRAYAYRCRADGAELVFTIEGDATSTNLGQYFVTMLGDVDGDGVSDVFASDWNNAAKGGATGRVFVHAGATGKLLLTLTGNNAGEGFGTSASVCGDVNGDGAADLVVGAWQNSEGARAGGKCYLHSGADGALLATWTSLQPGDTLGFDAVGLGDVDGDGATDFLFTSAWSAIDGQKQGRVFVVAGPKLRD